MIIGFSKHFGKGGSAPVLDYLTGYMLRAETRGVKPEVVRGDRGTGSSLRDQPCREKNRSGLRRALDAIAVVTQVAEQERHQQGGSDADSLVEVRGKAVME